MAKIELSPFRGLDEYTYPTLMKEGYSPWAVNVDMDGGILKTTDGYEKNSERPACNRLLFYYGGNQKDQVLGIVDGDICRLEGAWKVLYENFLQEGDSLDWINYQQNEDNILVLCNGRSEPLKYDGKEVGPLSEQAPVCSFVELHNERVWMSGDADNPDRIHYSASFAPDQWLTAEQSGFIDIPTWNGGNIKGIRSLFGDLVVFKDYDIFRIYGTYPGEFGVDPIHSREGCVSQNTIATTSDACYFISYGGLCVYNGVSAKVIPDKRLEAIFKQVDFERIEEANCTIFQTRLYMSLPMKKEDCIVEYDLSSGMLLKKEGIGVSQFFVEHNRLCFLDETGNTCVYAEGDTFGGRPIQSIWRSKTYDLSEKNMVKTMESIYMLAKGNGSVKLTIVCDGRPFEKIFSLEEEMHYQRIPIHGRGREFYVQLENVGGSSYYLDAPTLIIDCEVD